MPAIDPNEGNAEMTRNPLVFTMTLLTAILSLCLFFIALSNGWFGSYSGVGCKFCEGMRPGLIKQPANTWSNLGFVFAGLAMAWSLSSGRFERCHNALTQSVFMGTFFSSLVVLLGPGSMAMHASGTSRGGFCDVLSMYLVAAFLVAYSARRFFQFQPLYFAIVFFLVLSLCIWADKRLGIRILTLSSGNFAFAFFLFLTAVFESLNIFVRKMVHASGWAVASLVVLIGSFIIWNVSQTGRVWCDPQSLIQGHAAWHLLDALSVYCLFRYYVSEHAGAVQNY